MATEYANNLTLINSFNSTVLKNVSPTVVISYCKGHNAHIHTLLVTTTNTATTHYYYYYYYNHTCGCGCMPGQVLLSVNQPQHRHLSSVSLFLHPSPIHHSPVVVVVVDKQAFVAHHHVTHMTCWQNTTSNVSYQTVLMHLLVVVVAVVL